MERRCKALGNVPRFCPGAPVLEFMWYVDDIDSATDLRVSYVHRRGGRGRECHSRWRDFKFRLSDGGWSKSGRLEASASVSRGELHAYRAYARQQRLTEVKCRRLIVVSSRRTAVSVFHCS